MSRPRPLLAATLIVRDEAHQLASCLACLHGVADEVVVYDTGSRDGTPDVARRAGARVLRGYWDQDFSRARNAALEMTRAEWALIVDADERLVVDAARLRVWLAHGGPPARPAPRTGGFALTVVSWAADGQILAEHQSVRLVRPETACWQGRAHEILRFSSQDLVRLPLPPEIARLDHLGYADPAAVRAKAERNRALVQAELDALHASGSDDVVAGARVLFDLARSALELGDRQVAVDALEALLEIVAAGPVRAMATALLAQVLLDAGGFAEVALALQAELRADPCVDRRFADWILAQALAALGRPGEALLLLSGIDRLVDPAGTVLPQGRVLRAQAALAGAAGLPPFPGPSG